MLDDFSWRASAQYPPGPYNFPTNGKQPVILGPQGTPHMPAMIHTFQANAQQPQQGDMAPPAAAAGYEGGAPPPAGGGDMGENSAAPPEGGGQPNFEYAAADQGVGASES